MTEPTALPQDLRQLLIELGLRGWRYVHRAYGFNEQSDLTETDRAALNYAQQLCATYAVELRSLGIIAQHALQIMNHPNGGYEAAKEALEIGLASGSLAVFCHQPIPQTYLMPLIAAHQAQPDDFRKLLALLVELGQYTAR